MAETDTDPADEFDASISQGALDERTPGLFRRYRRLPRNVLVISLVSFLNDASSEIIYPLLPVFLSVSLGASPAIIGLIEGGAESVSSFLKLFAGYFSDRSGRRKAPVVFGYALASIARPLLGFATSWPQVFAVRFTDRVGKGIRSAPRDAMIADSAAPTERGLAFGFHRAMDHLGAVAGPLLGYALVAVIASDDDAIMPDEYRLIFLAASVPALAAVLVAALAIRETRRGKSKDIQRENAISGNVDAGRESANVKLESAYVKLESTDASHAATPKPPRFSLSGFDGNFKRFLVIIALFTLSNSSDAFLLLRARDIGIASSNLPLLWAALHGIKVLSSLVGGDLSDRLGRKTLIVTGWLFYAAVYLGFAFVSTVAGVLTLFLIYGIYFGLVEGAEKALVADLVPADKRGTAYGLYNLAFSITVWPASLLMGALWSWRGAGVAFVASACIGTLAAFLLAFTIRPGADKFQASPAR
jgi:MFS family permease